MYSFIGFEKIVQMLVEKGANVNAVNEDGLSVLDAASNAMEGNLETIGIAFEKKNCIIKSIISQAVKK